MFLSLYGWLFELHSHRSALPIKEVLQLGVLIVHVCTILYLRKDQKEEINSIRGHADNTEVLRKKNNKTGRKCARREKRNPIPNFLKKKRQEGLRCDW
jgi:hypothetical protein